MRLKILASAVEDLHRGQAFYARQSSSAGDYFLDALFSDIDSLELYAGLHAKSHGYFRLLAKRFPYAVYYKIDEDVCIVWRVLDCRRNPETIRNALSKKR